MQPFLPLITPAPSPDLIARQVIAGVCGYISGNPLSPLQCPSGFTCTSTQKFAQQWACCNSITCQNNWATCVNNGGNQCPGLDAQDCANIYGAILSCPATAPACMQYQRSVSVGATETDISWACATTTDPILVLAGTTGGKAVAATATNTAGSASGGTGSTGDTGSGSFSGSSTSSSTSVHGVPLGGIIAGSVIGFIFLLCVLVSCWWLGLFRCCTCPRRRRFDPHHGTTSEWAKDQSVRVGRVNSFEL